MYHTPEEKRAAATQRERERRARIKAEKIAEGSYRPPTSAQRAQLAKLNGTIDAKNAEAARMQEQGGLTNVPDLPEQVVSSLDKRSLYLAYLEKGLRRSQAAEKTGVSYSTVKYWRKTDEKFRAREADVEETFLDGVEDVVRQLAMMNDLKAAVTILERRRPEVWMPRKEVHVEHTLQFAGSIEERMQRINSLMEANKVPELEPVIWDATIVDDPADPQSSQRGS